MPKIQTKPNLPNNHSRPQLPQLPQLRRQSFLRQQSSSKAQENAMSKTAKIALALVGVGVSAMVIYSAIQGDPFAVWTLAKTVRTKVNEHIVQPVVEAVQKFFTQTAQTAQ